MKTKIKNTLLNITLAGLVTVGCSNSNEDIQNNLSTEITQNKNSIDITKVNNESETITKDKKQKSLQEIIESNKIINKEIINRLKRYSHEENDGMKTEYNITFPDNSSINYFEINTNNTDNKISLIAPLEITYIDLYSNGTIDGKYSKTNLLSNQGSPITIAQEYNKLGKNLLTQLKDKFIEIELGDLVYTRGYKNKNYKECEKFYGLSIDTKKYGEVTLLYYENIHCSPYKSSKNSKMGYKELSSNLPDKKSYFDNNINGTVDYLNIPNKYHIYEKDRYKIDHTENKEYRREGGWIPSELNTKLIEKEYHEFAHELVKVLTPEKAERKL